MWSDLLIVLACVFVIEGIMPFLAPTLWRNKMQEIAKLSEGQIRTFGIGLIIMGVLILGIYSLF